MELLIAFTLILVVSLLLGAPLGVALYQWNNKRVVVDTRAMDQKLAVFEYNQSVAVAQAMARYNNL